MAKEYIIEGLSVRLNPYENGIKDTVQINVEPRANFKPAAPKGAKPGQPGAAKPTAGAPNALPGKPSVLDANGLKKSNFENYYERKLAEER